MLMFFIRTRKPHNWASPKYRFSRRQDVAYKAMVAAAEEWITIQEESGEESGEESDGESEDENGDVRSKSSSSGRDQDDASMDGLERACMGFCIELLNQRIHNREYDMAMVCGLAVLGIAPLQGGFRDPETYPPILSSVIKIAHFMVVQHAEHIAQPSEEDAEFSPSGSACVFEDSGYESEEGQVWNGRGHRASGQRQRPSPQHRSSYDWVCWDDEHIHGARHGQSSAVVVGFVGVQVEDPLQRHGAGSRQLDGRTDVKVQVVGIQHGSIPTNGARVAHRRPLGVVRGFVVRRGRG